MEEQMSAEALWVVRAGCVEYGAAVALQERIHLARQEQRVPDVLLLLEHTPVITLGRGAHAEHLLADPAQLQRQGVAVHETARGGDITYHGPGQLVGYPIFDLNGHGRDVHRYLRNVEEALIQALERFGISGARAAGLTGVWVGNEKVAAIGVGVRRWVTWHGFALNVSTNLDAFSLIVPCGIRARGVTSLERLLGRPAPESEVTEAVISGFRDVFGLRPEERGLADLPGQPPMPG